MYITKTIVTKIMTIDPMALEKVIRKDNAIRPAISAATEMGELGFSIIERHGSKQTPSKEAKHIINLLKKDYPELAKENTSQQDFANALILKLKKAMPKNISHTKFAANILNSITQNPAVKTEVENLSKVLYYS